MRECRYLRRSPRRSLRRLGGRESLEILQLDVEEANAHRQDARHVMLGHDLVRREAQSLGRLEEHGHHAGRFLEHDSLAGDDLPEQSQSRQGNRRPDVGVTRERDLAHPGEDSHLARVVLVLGRQHEGRLGVGELPGVGQDGQRVATEQAVGEYIERHLVIEQQFPPCLEPRPSPMSRPAAMGTGK